MLRQRIRLLRRALLFGDGLAAAGLFVVASILRFGDGWQEAWIAAGAPWWVCAGLYGVLWMGAEWLQELNQLRSRWTFRGEVTDILRAAFLLAVGVFSLLFLVHLPEVSRLFLLGLFAGQVVLSVVQRRAFRSVIASRRNSFGTRNILVLGTGPVARTIASWLEQHPGLGYRVIGHLGQATDTHPDPLAPIEAIEPILHEGVVDEVVAALGPDEAHYLEPVIALCHEEGKRLRVVLGHGVAVVSGGRVETLGRLEVATISNGPDRLLGLLAKRGIDIVVSALLLTALAPFLGLIALAIRAHDGGPALFHQVRIGLHGRPFNVVKFRTMVPDAELQLAELASLNEVSGHAFKLSDDPRITPAGRLLRRTSLDELPQFWNVLRGEMSIVGPRPPLPDEVSGYDMWHRRRLSMKPGITGLWQVSARLEGEFDRWVELDLNYIDRWSLWLDLKIMLRTVPAMLSGR